MPDKSAAGRELDALSRCPVCGATNGHDSECPEREPCSCPLSCGGCACHINPPCHHCTDHGEPE